MEEIKVEEGIASYFIPAYLSNYGGLFLRIIIIEIPFVSF